jgi:hypothetical protein
MALKPKSKPNQATKPIEPIQEVEDLTDEEIAEEKTKYTRKIESPIYEPKGICPLIDTLYDTTKRDELIREIDNEDIFPELKDFLKAAAERHTVFNFSRIADYYAHAPVKYKHLFENSALVIIDYDKAIRNGFISFEKEVEESRIDYLENILTKEMMLKNREDVQSKKRKRAEEELKVLKSKPQPKTLSEIEEW